MAEKPLRLPLHRNGTGQALLLTTLALLALGVVLVHSAMASASPRDAQWYQRVDYRHAFFAAAAALVLATTWRFNYRWLTGRRVPWLAAALLLIAIVAAVLVYVPGIGHRVGGQARWIRLGPEQYSIGFQPSELLKVALVLTLAAWMTRPGVNLRRLGTILPAGGLIALCVGLVITQDMGTGILIGLSAAATLMLAGVPLRWLGLMGLTAAGGGWAMVLQDPARLNRLHAMLDPWCLENPAAFHARASLLTILSGGWFGKGVGGGVRKLGYLPEDTTDFIFAVFVEEWGFLGGLLLMAVIGMWILLARRSATRSQDTFGRVLAGSLGFLIGIQAVLHIAVDLVAAPPTGMSLPFVSAGGTSLLILAAAVGMIVSVTTFRHETPTLDADADPPPSASAARAKARRRPDKQAPARHDDEPAEDPLAESVQTDDEGADGQADECADADEETDESCEADDDEQVPADVARADEEACQTQAGRGSAGAAEGVYQPVRPDRLTADAAYAFDLGALSASADDEPADDASADGDDEADAPSELDTYRPEAVGRHLLFAEMEGGRQEAAGDADDPDDAGAEDAAAEVQAADALHSPHPQGREPDEADDEAGPDYVAEDDERDDPQEPDESDASDDADEPDRWEEPDDAEDEAEETHPSRTLQPGPAGDA